MSQVKFYMDEHVSRAVVAGLRNRGADVLTVQEASMLGATDTAHMARARAEARVIVTQDADFLRLHAGGAEHTDRKSTRLNSSHIQKSRMPSSA